MRKWLKRILRRRERSGLGSRPERNDSGAAAHVAGETPEPLHPGRRRLKETFTSHWDLDYLPRDELDSLADGKTSRED